MLSRILDRESRMDTRLMSASMEAGVTACMGEPYSYLFLLTIVWKCFLCLHLRVLLLLDDDGDDKMALLVTNEGDVGDEALLLLLQEEFFGLAVVVVCDIVLLLIV